MLRHSTKEKNNHIDENKENLKLIEHIIVSGLKNDGISKAKIL